MSCLLKVRSDYYSTVVSLSILGKPRNVVLVLVLEGQVLVDM